MRMDCRLLPIKSKKQFQAKKWNEIGPNHVAKAMFFARTRRTLQPKPNHMPKTQNAATDNPLKPTFFAYKTCFFYLNKSH